MLNNKDIDENSKLCNDIAAKLKRGNKLIKMAEESIAVLETIAKYETDPISSNSDGGKKISHVRVGHSANKKAKPTVGVPSYGASGYQFQIDDKYNDYEEAKIKSELFRETLIKSGFIPENEKSTWEPRKIVTGLGIDVNLSSVALKITRS